MTNPLSTANGLPKRGKKKGSEDSHGSREPLHFGKLTKRLESEIEVLNPAYTALTNISNLFQEYRSEVEVFERDFGTMNSKNEEIENLKAAMRVWKSTRDEQVDSLQEELKTMKEERENFQKERHQFETMRDQKTQELVEKEKQLVENENGLKEEYEQRWKKKRDLLKADSRETIAKLQLANQKMSKEIDDLKAQLAGASETNANEKEDWSIVRSKLTEESRSLRKEMESLVNEFAIEDRPDDF